LVIGGKCKESIFGKGRVARKFFIGEKSISYFTQKKLYIFSRSVTSPYEPYLALYELSTNRETQRIEAITTKPSPIISLICKPGFIYISFTYLSSFIP
jgi:hypothetical protein